MTRSLRPKLEDLESKALMTAGIAGLHGTLTAVVEKTTLGEEVVATFTETNVTNHDITVTRAGDDAGFLVTQAGKPVWATYGSGIAVPALATSQTLKPHQSIKIVGTWDGRANLINSEDASKDGAAISGPVTITNTLDGGKASAKVVVPAAPKPGAGLKASLTAKVEETASGVQVVSTLTETNVTNHDITVPRLGANARFYVTQGGKIVWQNYGPGVYFTPLVTSETLKPHQSIQNVSTWDGRMNLTNSVDPSKDGAAITGPVTITSGLEGVNASAKVVVPAAPKTGEGLKASLTAKVEETASGVQVVSTLTETNATNHDITVARLGGDAGFGVTQAGKLVWATYGSGIAIPALATTETLKPHESIKIVSTWDGRMNLTNSEDHSQDGAAITGPVTITSGLDGVEASTKVVVPAAPKPAQEMKVSLTAKVEKTSSGVQVVATLTETNVTNHDISFGEGPSIDGFIGTQAGKDVWVSNGGIQPDFIVRETLKPHQSFKLTQTWDGRTSPSDFFNPTEGPMVSGPVTIYSEPVGPTVSARVVLPKVSS